MSDKPKPPFDRSAKKSLAEERAIEGAKAMTEYKAEHAAERAKDWRTKLAPHRQKFAKIPEQELDDISLTRKSRAYFCSSDIPHPARTGWLGI